MSLSPGSHCSTSSDISISHNNTQTAQQFNSYYQPQQQQQQAQQYSQQQHHLSSYFPTPAPTPPPPNHPNHNHNYHHYNNYPDPIAQHPSVSSYNNYNSNNNNNWAQNPNINGGYNNYYQQHQPQHHLHQQQQQHQYQPPQSSNNFQHPQSSPQHSPNSLASLSQFVSNQSPSSSSPQHQLNQLVTSSSSGPGNSISSICPSPLPSPGNNCSSPPTGALAQYRSQSPTRPLPAASPSMMMPVRLQNMSNGARTKAGMRKLLQEQGTSVTTMFPTLESGPIPLVSPTELDAPSQNPQFMMDMDTDSSEFELSSTSLEIGAGVEEESSNANTKNPNKNFNSPSGKSKSKPNPRPPRVPKNLKKQKLMAPKTEPKPEPTKKKSKSSTTPVPAPSEVFEFPNSPEADSRCASIEEAIEAALRKSRRISFTDETEHLSTMGKSKKRKRASSASPRKTTAPVPVAVFADSNSLGAWSLEPSSSQSSNKNKKLQPIKFKRWSISDDSTSAPKQAAANSKPFVKNSPQKSPVAPKGKAKRSPIKLRKSATTPSSTSAPKDKASSPLVPESSAPAPTPKARNRKPKSAPAKVKKNSVSIDVEAPEPDLSVTAAAPPPETSKPQLPLRKPPKKRRRKRVLGMKRRRPVVRKNKVDVEDPKPAQDAPVSKESKEQENPVLPVVPNPKPMVPKRAIKRAATPRTRTRKAPRKRMRRPKDPNPSSTENLNSMPLPTISAEETPATTSDSKELEIKVPEPTETVSNTAQQSQPEVRVKRKWTRRKPYIPIAVRRAAAKAAATATSAATSTEVPEVIIKKEKGIEDPVQSVPVLGRPPKSKSLKISSIKKKSKSPAHSTDISLKSNAKLIIQTPKSSPVPLRKLRSNSVDPNVLEPASFTSPEETKLLVPGTESTPPGGMDLRLSTDKIKIPASRKRKTDPVSSAAASGGKRRCLTKSKSVSPSRNKKSVPESVLVYPELIGIIRQSPEISESVQSVPKPPAKSPQSGAGPKSVRKSPAKSSPGVSDSGGICIKTESVRKSPAKSPRTSESGAGSSPKVVRKAKCITVAIPLGSPEITGNSASTTAPKTTVNHRKSSSSSSTGNGRTKKAVPLSIQNGFGPTANTIHNSAISKIKRIRPKNEGARKIVGCTPPGSVKLSPSKGSSSSLPTDPVPEPTNQGPQIISYPGRGPRVLVPNAKPSTSTSKASSSVTSNSTKIIGPTVRVKNGKAKISRIGPGAGSKDDDCLESIVTTSGTTIKEIMTTTFDPNVQNECAFCTIGPYIERMGALFGPYYTEPGHHETWMHEDCIVWNNDIIPAGTTLRGLSEAILDAQQVPCYVCDRVGAFTGCFNRSCELTVHIPCARINGWRLNTVNFHSYCPDHAHEDPDELHNPAPWIRM